MKYIRLKTTDPYYNLAVEEYLFKHTEGEVFMLWQNAPSVIIGVNQNAYAEADLDYAAENGINIARRITGGGAVYHDLGNLNYSFITSTDNADISDRAYFARPVMSALEALGVSCTLSGRNDIELEGRKISGSAATQSGKRILHHGTLLFNVDTEKMAGVLRIDREKLAYRAIASHKSRVANLAERAGGISVGEFIDLVERRVIEYTGAERAEIPENEIIEGLAERNTSAEWILSDRRFLTDYTVKRKRRYPYGSVLVEMHMRGDFVERAVISGDFFGSEPVEGLERAVEGKRLSEVAVTGVSRYISRMTDEEFAELIKG